MAHAPNLDLTFPDPYQDALVGVALGGVSSEREISLRTGQALALALTSQGYKVRAYDLPAEINALMADRPAAVVLAMHGGMGENGVIQGFLESMGIPYTGSGVLASALAMDKERAKSVMAAEGVPVAKGLRLPAPGAGQLDAQAIAAMLTQAGMALPVIVKLNDGGSSVGVHIGTTHENVADALAELASQAGGGASAGILVESFLNGAEYTVGFFDEECLGSIEVVVPQGFYDFTAKYQSGQTRYEPVIDAQLHSRLETVGRRAYNALGCKGVARVDIKATVDDAGDTQWCVLEVNTVPGMTATSLIPKMAAQRGVGFEALARRILLSATLESAG